MCLYDIDWVLSNDGMTLAFQGRGHRILTIRITDMEKMAYFSEITGPHSLSIQQYAGWQILVGIFQKLTPSTL